MDPIDEEYGDLFGILFPNKYGVERTSDVVSYTVKPKQRIVEFTNSSGEVGELSCDELRAYIEQANRMGMPLIPWMLDADRACREAGVTKTPKDEKAEQDATITALSEEAIDPIWLAVGIVGGALLIKRLRK